MSNFIFASSSSSSSHSIKEESFDSSKLVENSTAKEHGEEDTLVPPAVTSQYLYILAEDTKNAFQCGDADSVLEVPSVDSVERFLVASPAFKSAIAALKQAVHLEKKVCKYDNYIRIDCGTIEGALSVRDILWTQASKSNTSKVPLLCDPPAKLLSQESFALQCVELSSQFRSFHRVVLGSEWGTCSACRTFHEQKLPDSLRDKHPLPDIDTVDDITRTIDRRFLELPITRSGLNVCLSLMHILSCPPSKMRTISHALFSWPALHIAAARKASMSVSILLTHGVAVDARGCLGLTALHVAVFLSNQDIVAMLLNAGADPNMTTHRLFRPLHLARSSTVVKLLLKSGASASERVDDGSTPLHFAMRYGDIGAVGLLLASQEKAMQMKNKWEWTPLHEAIDSQNIDCVLYMISHGCWVEKSKDWDPMQLCIRHFFADNEKTSLSPKLAKYPDALVWATFRLIDAAPPMSHLLSSLGAGRRVWAKMLVAFVGIDFFAVTIRKFANVGETNASPGRIRRRRILRVKKSARIARTEEQTKESDQDIFGTSSSDVGEEEIGVVGASLPDTGTRGPGLSHLKIEGLSITSGT